MSRKYPVSRKYISDWGARAAPNSPYHPPLIHIIMSLALYDHTYSPPSPGASRSPCPALNALANHGYM